MATDNNITENSDYLYGLWLSRYYGKGIIYSQARCIKEIKRLLSEGLLPEKPKLRCDLGRFLYLEMSSDNTEVEWLAINLIDLASSDGFTEATELLEKIRKKYSEQAKNGDLMSQSILERFSTLKNPHEAEKYFQKTVEAGHYKARKRLDNIRPATETYSKVDTDLLNKVYELLKELRLDSFENTQKIIAHTDEQHERTRAVVIAESETIRKSVEDIPEKVMKRIASELDNVTGKFSPRFSEIENMHMQMRGDISDIKQAVGTMNSYAEELTSQMQAFFEKMDEACRAQLNISECGKLRMACEKELEDFFGEYWENGQLLKSTKESLIAAEVLLACAEREKVCDCRGIVISATSALELELKARFYTGVRKYFAEARVWDGTTEEDLPENLRRKIKRNGEKEDKFTLGNVYYILNCEKYDSEELLNGYSEEQVEYLRSYLNGILSDDVVSNVYRYGERDYSAECPEDVFIFGGYSSFTGKISEIVQRYRNPAAHTNTTSKEKAQECCVAVIGQEKASITKIEGILFDLLRLTKKFNHSNRFD